MVRNLVTLSGPKGPHRLARPGLAALAVGFVGPIALTEFGGFARDEPPLAHVFEPSRSAISLPHPAARIERLERMIVPMKRTPSFS